MSEYVNSKDGLMRFSYDLYARLEGDGRPIFLCVGSDKFVCDSVAPIVAEMLKNDYNINAYVYGGLDYNINATNLIEAINYIETVHPNTHIVLVDVTLGDGVGKVVLTNGSYAGLGKRLPIRKIGITSILAIVGKKIANFDLNSVRLRRVMELARFIAKGCFLAVSKLNKNKIDENHQKSSYGIY